MPGMISKSKVSAEVSFSKNSNNNRSSSSFRRMFRKQQRGRSNGTASTNASCSSFLSGDDDRLDSVLSMGGGTEVLARASPTHAVWYQAGLQEWEAENYPEALQCFTKALEETSSSSSSSNETEGDAVVVEARDDDQQLHQQQRILVQLIKTCLELAGPSESSQPPIDDEFYHQAVEYGRQVDWSTVDWSHMTPTRALLLFLMHQHEWAAAVQVSDALDDDKKDDDVLAKIYYNLGLEEGHDFDQSLVSLQRSMEYLKDDEKGRYRVQSAIVQLCLAHDQQDEAMRLVQDFESQLPWFGSSPAYAKLELLKAEIWTSQGCNDEALKALETGLSQDPDALLLLDAKAELLWHIGRMDQAIQLYEDTMKLDHCSATEQTKILYTLARIAQKRGKPQDALGYSQREVAIVRRTFGKKHLEVARIYHDMAKILDEVLLEYDLALKYFQKTLAIAKWNLQNVQQKALVCRDAHVCESYEAQMQEISSMILETNKYIGRIYYKKGDFASAMRASFGPTR